MSSNVIVDKSFKFSIRIIKIYKYLVHEKREWVLGKQLLRSGTSIGANVMEGVNGVSKPDFKNKLGIAFKEAKETEYWLELLIAAVAAQVSPSLFLGDVVIEYMFEDNMLKPNSIRFNDYDK